MHSQGALLLKLCAREILHAPSQYVVMINGSKIVHTTHAHLRLISDTCTLYSMAEIQENVSSGPKFSQSSQKFLNAN